MVIIIKSTITCDFQSKSKADILRSSLCILFSFKKFYSCYMIIKNTDNNKTRLYTNLTEFYFTNIVTVQLYSLDLNSHS